MRFNQELRTQKIIFRYRLKWIIFYAITILVIAVIGFVIYHELQENRHVGDNIQLSVDKQEYNVGDTISFTVNNKFTTPIYINNKCPEEPLRVYEWSDNKWKPIHAIATTHDSECFKQSRLITIPAGSSTTANFNDWPDLFKNPGVYRLVLEVEHFDDVPYQDFKVLQPQESNSQTTPTPTNTNQQPTPAPSSGTLNQEREVEPQEPQEVHDD